MLTAIDCTVQAQAVDASAVHMDYPPGYKGQEKPSDGAAVSVARRSLAERSTPYMTALPDLPIISGVLSL